MQPSLCIALLLGATVGPTACMARGIAAAPIDTPPALRAPSADPPGGLHPGEVPMFVSLGFDDNGAPGVEGRGGMSWALDVFRDRTNPDGSPARASFYMTTQYIGGDAADASAVRHAWHRAQVDGHEVGNHTHRHLDGSTFTAEEWTAELQRSQDWLTRPLREGRRTASELGAGIEPASIRGFRAPFLSYNDALFGALRQAGFAYDCSIEDGFQPDQDGANYLWPYTLDFGSPGHEVLVGWGLKEPISHHPGLWELPVHPVIVPPDEACEDYGVAPGLRARLKERVDWFDLDQGKITGFDYNLWVLFGLTEAEFLATLKYTLDLRLSGNRAPFLFGAHTDLYDDSYPEPIPNADLEARQRALVAFLDHAGSLPEARLVPMAGVLDWVRNPEAIR